MEGGSADTQLQRCTAGLCKRGRLDSLSASRAGRSLFRAVPEWKFKILGKLRTAVLSMPLQSRLLRNTSLSLVQSTGAEKASEHNVQGVRARADHAQQVLDAQPKIMPQMLNRPTPTSGPLQAATTIGVSGEAY